MNFYSRRAQATTGADLCARWGKMTTWVTISHLDSDLIGHLDYVGYIFNRPFGY